MIATLVWGFVALVAITAIYDLTLKAIKTWAPKVPLTKAEGIDTAILTAKVNGLVNDVNALKIKAGFHEAMKVGAK